MRSDLAVLARVGRWLTRSWALLRLERLVPLSEAKSALAVMGAETFTLMGELSKVEAHRIPLAAAVRDPGNYPHLARVHQGLEDVLTLTLPEPLRSWAEELLANPPVGLLQTLDESFACWAVDETIPAPLRRLARFGLFEGVRLNLIAFDQMAGDQSIAGVGLTMEDLDQVAEEEVEYLLLIAQRGELGPPSLTVGVVAGLLALHARADQLRGTLGARFHDLQAYASAQAHLNKLDAVDAILLREWAESPSGKLDPDLARRRHALVLGDMRSGTLSTRLSRVLRRLKEGRPPPPRRALLDLFADGWRNLP